MSEQNWNDEIMTLKSALTKRKFVLLKIFANRQKISRKLKKITSGIFREIIRYI